MTKLHVAYIDDESILPEAHAIDADYDVELHPRNFDDVRAGREPHADLYVFDILERSRRGDGEEVDDPVGGALTALPVFKKRRPHARVVAFTNLLTAARLRVLEAAVSLTASNAGLRERLLAVASTGIAWGSISEALSVGSEQEHQRHKQLMMVGTFLRGGLLSEIYSKVVRTSPARPAPPEDNSPENRAFRCMLDAELPALRYAAGFPPDAVHFVAVHSNDVPGWLKEYLKARGLESVAVAAAKANGWKWIAFSRYGEAHVVSSGIGCVPLRISKGPCDSPVPGWSGFASSVDAGEYHYNDYPRVYSTADTGLNKSKLQNAPQLEKALGMKIIGLGDRVTFSESARLVYHLPAACSLQALFER